MEGINLKFKGWSGIVVLVLIGGFLIFRYFTMFSTLKEDAKKELKLFLAGEYTSDIVKDISPEDVDTMSYEYAEELTQKVLSTQKIEFKSIRARGHSDEVIVEVVFTIDGNPPPDGRDKRYYLMKYNPLTGWRVIREVSSLRFYLKLF